MTVEAASGARPTGVDPEVDGGSMAAARLAALLSRFCGTKLVAALPAVSPDGHHTDGFEALRTATSAVDVVVFPDVPVGDLDAFFHLRLGQVLRGEGPSPGLSVVVLAAEPSGRRLAGGFAERFRSGWPFARCVFVTDGDDQAGLSAALGLRVGLAAAAGSGDAAAVGAEAGWAILLSEAAAGQQIAVQLQTTWGRSGGTTLFENQIEGLVRAGYLTIRLFSNARVRRGPTLTALLEQIIPENSANAGAHIDAVAVPEGPPLYLGTDRADEGWAASLAADALCRVRDPATAAAVRLAGVAIANLIQTVGAAVHLAPGARLLLDLHDDQAEALRDWMVQAGAGQAQTDAAVVAAADAQAGVMAIADICTHVSVTDMARLAPHCRRNAIVLPRIYARPVPQSGQPRFDVLVVGDAHPANIASLQWFLDEVWRPYLEPQAVRVVIVGRAGQHLKAASYASPALHIVGFVDDLNAFRASCRLTVVPDRGRASGISMKLLTTLAVEHPLVTTSYGLRGLDPGLAGMLPARDEPADFAADVLELLREPDRLTERRRLVGRVQQAIARGPAYADLVRSLPRPDEAVVAARLIRWEQLVAAAPPADPSGALFRLDASFTMSGSPADPLVLRDGWHEAEPWGRWTDGAEASLWVTLAAPVDGPLMLELDIIPSPVGAALELRIGPVRFPAIVPVSGTNGWAIPPGVIDQTGRFPVTLRVADTVCPARSGNSPDSRILGIGVAAVRVRRSQPTIVALGENLVVNRDAAPRDVLLAGWHVLETWGCWSSGRTASLRVTLDEPLHGHFRLELDLVPTEAATMLTVSVNEWAAVPRVPAAGINRWELPPGLCEGDDRLLITLTVSRTFCPMEADGRSDDRILGVGLCGVRVCRFEPVSIAIGARLRLAAPAELDGIGVRSVSLHREAAAAIAIGGLVRISSEIGDSGVLVDGWHKAERWGCWSSGREASMRLRFDAPLRGDYCIVVDLIPPLLDPDITLVVNDVVLEPRGVVAGRNEWRLPCVCTEGQRVLDLCFVVEMPVRPADIRDSADDRVLGVGIKSVLIRGVDASG